MKKSVIRIIALIMCTVMLFGALPLGVYAAEAEKKEKVTEKDINIMILEQAVISLESISAYLNSKSTSSFAEKAIEDVAGKNTAENYSETAETLDKIIAYLNGAISGEPEKVLPAKSEKQLSQTANSLVELASVAASEELLKLIPEETAKDIVYAAEIVQAISKYFEDHDLADLAGDIANKVAPEASTVLGELKAIITDIFTKLGLYVKSDSSLKESGIVGYLYDAKENCFYTAEDPWQRPVGYNILFDGASPLTFINYDTVRFKFDYADKNWLIQVWKGQYGALFYGAEIGVYNKPSSRYLPHYDSVGDDERLKMSMEFYEYEKKLFKKGEWKLQFTRPYGEYWWCTGFLPGNKLGQFDKLRVKARVTMEDYSMLRAFVSAVKSNGVPYTTNGLDVTFTYG